MCVSEEDKFGGQKTTSGPHPNLLTLSEARFLLHHSISQTSGLVNFWGVSTRGLKMHASASDFPWLLGIPVFAAVCQVFYPLSCLLCSLGLKRVARFGGGGIFKKWGLIKKKGRSPGLSDQGLKLETMNPKKPFLFIS